MTKVSALSNADLEPRITTEAIVQKLAEAGVQAERTGLTARVASTTREIRFPRDVDDQAGKSAS